MCGFVVCPHTVASVATSVSPAIVVYYVRKVIQSFFKFTQFLFPH